MFRRLQTASLAVAWMLIATAASSGKTGLSGISLKIDGGFSKVRVGDTNTNIEELVRNWENAAGTRGFDIAEALQTLGLGREGEVEVRFRIRPGWSVGAGVGRLLLEKNDNRMEMALPPPIWHQVQNQNSRISAMPLFVNLYYLKPVISRASLFARIGAGYYSARWYEWGRYEAESEGVAPWWREWELDAKSGGLGFQGGFGLEIGIFRWLALSMEGYGRFCKISGFKGDGTVWRSWTPPSGYSDQTLYYFEWKDALTSSWYGDVNLRDAVPAGETERNGREAEVDLSAVGFRIGMILRLK
jgi:hypothetical protein